MKAIVFAVWYAGGAFTILYYLTHDEPLYAAHFFFWPVFAIRGLWRSWKLAWRE